MAFERPDTKKLIFTGGIVVALVLAGVVWYPRLFPAKRPVRVVQAPPPLIQIEPPSRAGAAVVPAAPEPSAPPSLERQAPAPRQAQAARPAPSPAPVAATPVTPAQPRSVAKAAVADPPATSRSRAAEPDAAPRAAYGLAFPPFVTAADAAELERRLKQAGLPTLQTTRDGSSLYSLLVGPFADAAKAREAHAALGAKPQGSGDDPLVVRDGPFVLRDVVRRALEVREQGYPVKIVVEGDAPHYVLRTATRLDAAQASRLSRHYRELGFPNSVVSAR